jgi:threonine/homoserine/homoserine lactone efflux protein
MNEHIIAGVALVLMGVATIIFCGMNRRWGRWTPGPGAMRIIYLVIGVLWIGLGLLVVIRAAP